MGESQSRVQKQTTKNGSEQKPGPAATLPAVSPAIQRAPRFAGGDDGSAAIPLMGGAAQTKVAVGSPGDPLEKEADSVANRVKSRETVQPSSISNLGSGAAGRMAGDSEKKPEDKAVQKAETPKTGAAPGPTPATKPEEKRPDTKAVQKTEAPKAGATPGPTPTTKPEEKKPDTKAVQKADAPKAGATPGPTPATKPEEKKPDTKAVQKAEAPKPGATPVTKPEEKKPEGKPVQRQEKAGGDAMSDVAEGAISKKGSGRPMNPDTRNTLESQMGTDLSGVRVHDDAGAQQAASDLDARAFTHQNDIWLGSGESDSDVGLMAHETTHVIQQATDIERKVIQRTDKKGGKASKDSEATINGDQIEIPGLSLPKVADKDSVTFPLKIPRTFTRSNKQRDEWKSKINVDSAVESKLPKKGIKSEKSQKELFYLKLSARESFIVGDRDTLKQRLRLPNWTKNGANYPFDVDHIIELQLGGKDDISNLQLLDFSANRSAGSKIDAEIERRINEGIAPHVGNEPGKKWKRKPSVDSVRKKFDITFKKLDGNLPLKGDAKNRRWTKPQVEDGKHLEPLDVLNAKQVKAYNLLVDETKLQLFTSEGAGKPMVIDWDPKKDVKTLSKEDWVKGFDLESVKYAPGQDSFLEGTLYKRNNHILQKKFPVPLIEDGPYIVRMSLSSLRAQVGALRAKRLSLIEIYDVALGESFVVRGVIRPSLPLFKDLEIDITIDGEDVMFSKTFSADEIDFPKPISVTEAALTISAGTAGLKVQGDVMFEIERVGKGQLSGKGDSSGGFGIKGTFEFDSKLFKPAEIQAWYEDDDFGAKGKLGIQEGKVKGIKSATVEATYSKGKLEATGKAELSIPGIKSADMSLSYSPEEGLAIGGSFELANNIPGIKSGSGSATVKQKKGAEGYEVTAKGTAVPSIPGVTSSIDITYENGAITIEGTVAYEKGMLKGSVTVGVTNRPVDDGGQPGGGPGGDTLKLYGGGSVTIKIAPWLQGTVGIKLLPDGNIIITGEIGLPSALDVFPEKKFDKRVFSIGIDIPIVGVSVLGQRIGIFATISGGVDLTAGIGPGQIKDLKLGITYNPADEAATVVTGHGLFRIPAHAGLRLFVRGGIGVGIPIVSASAGIEVGGEVGLEGAAEAGVDVNWTPTHGVVLDALGKIYVEPKFKFDVSAYVNVEADLLFKTITLYDEKWQLAGFEWGSGLRFGVEFPIHYEENKPFNISLDDLKFQVPDINPSELISSLLK